MDNNNSFIALCKPGLVPFCVQELQQLSCSNIVAGSENVLFELTSVNNLHKVFQQLASVYSLSQVLWQGDNTSAMNITEKHSEKIISCLSADKQEFKFRVLCEGISGNEKRIKLAAELNKLLIAQFNKHNLKAIVDYKKPQCIFSLSQDPKTKQYTFGLKLHKKDLDKREWRVFTHKASFRGDFAAAICESAGIPSMKKLEKYMQGNEKYSLGCIFSRDGAVAIEAVCKLTQSPVRALSPSIMQWTKQSSQSSEKPRKEVEVHKTENVQVYLMDDSGTNIRASVNNAKMATVNEYMKFLSLSIDQIDQQIPKNTFHAVIAHLTVKDERRINVLLKQIEYILKSKGTVLFIARPGFEIEEDSRFSLQSHTIIPRGSGSISLFSFKKRE